MQLHPLRFAVPRFVVTNEAVCITKRPGTSELFNEHVIAAICVLVLLSSKDSVVVGLYGVLVTDSSQLTTPWCLSAKLPVDFFVLRTHPVHRQGLTPQSCLLQIQFWFV